MSPVLLYNLRITVELYQDGLVVIDVVQVKDKPLIKVLG